ncbi:MAG: RNA-binding transcriptional accessory protein [Oscillospiraceae bacterium]|nr:RNA-binding transcriptional accessory protein [Oscillospiraceae bacterium]
MDILKTLCAELDVRLDYGENIVKLLDEGNTIPFIARYRKELHGEMDDQRIRQFAERLEALRAIEERRAEVSRLIDEQGKLTDELTEKINAAKTMTELEDIYRPYRPKRRTRASIAREKGLAPLAELIFGQEFQGDITKEAEKYIDEEKGVTNAQEAIDGAKDIIAEDVSDNADFRKEIRRLTYRDGTIRSAQGKEENPTYQMYFEFAEPVNRVADHRILAMNRGEKEGALSVKIEVEPELIHSYLGRKLLKKNGTLHSLVTESYEDAYKRLIAPSIENEIRGILTERAETGAISLFGINLKNLLLTPPVKGHVVLGVDPGYRTGCKLAVVDETGKVLETGVGYFTLEHHDKARAKAQLTRLIEKHGVTLVSIGNGTATGESESFVSELISELPRKVQYMVVSEAGASVYSASKLAAEEFPDYDVSLRSAVSIARRLQDPLAELVKIDPKSIGVGQYQHDCNQKQLSGALGGVVEDCVNSVGVDLNTASAPLLGYVSGINGTVAKNIVEYREQNGRFTSRKQLLKVAKLGNKAFEQSAGFMRISGGKEFLDNTSVHPESYAAAKELISLCGYGEEERKKGVFPGLAARIGAMNKAELAEKLGIGEPTLNDIIDSLQRPGRDPRDELPKPLLRSGCLSLEDLRPGQIMDGTVRNVIDFGAFVDIGVHQDGLVHISQIANRYIKHPTEVLSVGDVVKVKVLSVDPKTKRISLSIKEAINKE